MDGNTFSSSFYYLFYELTDSAKGNSITLLKAEKKFISQLQIDE
jgi:hypothetical protein